MFIRHPLLEPYSSCVDARERLVERVSRDLDDEVGTLRVVPFRDVGTAVPEQVACDLDASRVRYRGRDRLAETAEGEMLGVDPDSQQFRLELRTTHYLLPSGCPAVSARAT